MKHLLIVCILLLTGQISHAATLRPSPKQLAILNRTIDLIFADSFSQAYEEVREFPDTLDGQPVYHLIYASLLHAEMMDLEDYSEERVFFSHIDASIHSLKKWTDNNPDDAWGYFFLGSAFGYKSLLQAQKGSWLKSLLSGLKAKGRFSDAIKLDSTLYDAYTGMGSYHFWSSVKLGKYLPFLPDNREMGLRELRIAADSSLFSRKPAVTGLAWALLYEKKSDEALRIGDELYRETDGGRNALWILGGAYWRMGNLPLAAEYYGELLESFLKLDRQNYYNVIFCRYRRGVSLFGMGRIEQAKADFESILSYDVSKEVRKRHDKTYEKTRDYLKRIEKQQSRR